MSFGLAIATIQIAQISQVFFLQYQQSLGLARGLCSTRASPVHSLKLTLELHDAIPLLARASK